MKLIGAGQKPFESLDEDEGALASLTTKTAVKKLLGPATRSFADDRIWVYSEADNGLWLSVYPTISALLLPGIPRIPGLVMHSGSNPTFQVFEFDSNGAVTGERRTKAGFNCSEGICVGRLSTYETLMYSGVFTLDAPGWYTFNEDSRRCTLQMYDRRFSSGGGAKIWIDGSPAGWLLSPKTYQQWPLSPGEREIFVRAGRKSALLTVDCQPGNTVLVSFSGDDEGQLETVDQVTGKSPLDERNLVLTNWQDAGILQQQGKNPDLKLDWLVSDRITRKSMLDELGPPNFALGDGSKAAYVSEPPDWQSMTGKDLGETALGDTYVLTVEFDETGALKSYLVAYINVLDESFATQGNEEQFSLRRLSRYHPYCSEGNLCMSPSGAITQFASSQANREVENKIDSFNRDTSHCYMYLWSDSQEEAHLRVDLNGVTQGYLADAIWPDGFFAWRLPVGPQEIRVIGPSTDGNPPEVSQTVDCVGKKVVSVAVEKKKDALALDTRTSMKAPRVELLDRHYISTANGIVREDAPVFGHAAVDRLLLD